MLRTATIAQEDRFRPNCGDSRLASKS